MVCLAILLFVDCSYADTKCMAHSRSGNCETEIILESLCETVYEFSPGNTSTVCYTCDQAKEKQETLDDTWKPWLDFCNLSCPNNLLHAQYFYNTSNSELVLGCVCPSGYIVDGAVCTACPAGKSDWSFPSSSDFPYLYANGTSCLDCDSNTFSNKSGSLCQNCDKIGPDYGYSHNGRTSCEACAPGKFYDYVSENCDLCYQGSFSNDSNGQTECYNCELGTFANTSGSSFCMPCYLPVQSTSSCTCNIGYGIRDLKTCEICQPGYYSDDSVTCLQCSSVEISKNTGSSSCELCDNGKEPNESRTDCVPYSSKHSNALYWFIPVASVIFLLAILLVYLYIRKTRNRIQGIPYQLVNNS
jgi:hypothetical protein